jgi:hypothetical protein
VINKQPNILHIEENKR